MNTNNATLVQSDPSTGVTTPEPPYSIFDKRQKRLIIIIHPNSLRIAFDIYFPALPTIANDLNVSIELVDLIVTSYLIFQGLAPSLWGLSLWCERSPDSIFVHIRCLSGASIGLAETKSYPTLIVLRCLQSTGSATTIAIGFGVIRDITTRAERGGYMGIFQAGLLVPVAVGPVIGGGIAGSLGSKAIFWFLTMYTGAFLRFLIVLLPETLRSIIGNGGFEAFQTHWLTKKRVDALGNLRILISNHAAPIIIFLAPLWFARDTNHVDFIANGVRSMIGTLVTGKIVDVDYRRVKARYEALLDTEQGGKSNAATREENIPLEKTRLRLVHIAVSLVSTFITGWTAVSTQSLIMTYPIDVFPDRSAAASASLSLARCLFAAGGTSFIMPLINRVWVGVAFTICWRFAAGWRRMERERDAQRAGVKNSKSLFRRKLSLCPSYS
ncbi:major facilitator superfamily domain-containing protein [Aspergillus welwitschiae]|uniref:Major facilitator superfamily domain-containing protein n=1 Tax=Aspergillus welwitschiae TaxID=1341132 RepID=A0A3F3QB25_9EURO|nr:major facilitator superfamily domain-containing protein [Aspergillus welwitschiae]RDH35966.1 major facilitator superfamily domain-containing protein [Aspergillus welwitschiae]